MSSTDIQRPRGRPRAFDEVDVLDRAVALFGTSGFSAASMSDLKEATGLTGGSIYKAFQSKEGLFSRALSHYGSRQERHLGAALEGADSGRARLARLLGFYADLSQGEPGRRGCLVVAGVTQLEQVGDAAVILTDLLTRRRALLCRLVAEGQSDGSILTPEAPGDVADLLLALLSGMRLMGRSGLFPHRSDAFIRLALGSLD